MVSSNSFSLPCEINVSEDLHRCGRTSLLHASALIVDHGTNLSVAASGRYRLSDLQCTLLYKNGSYRTAALIQLSLDNKPSCMTSWIGLQLTDLGCQKNHLQQSINTFMCMCRNRYEDGASAPILRNQLVFGKLLLHPLYIGAWLIDLVDGYDNIHSCGLGMADGFHSLRHNAVVCRHNKDRDICSVSSAHTHGRKCLMPRCIQECDLLAVAGNHIGSDMLGDTACLTINDMRVTDGIQQRGFSVIDMAHHAYYRRTLHHLALVLFVLLQEFLDNVYFLLHLTDAVELQCDLLCLLIIDLLVHCHHDSLQEKLLHNGGGLNFHSICKLLDSQLLRQNNGPNLIFLLFHRCRNLLHLLVLPGALLQIHQTLLLLRPLRPILRLLLVYISTAAVARFLPWLIGNDRSILIHFVDFLLEPISLLLRSAAADSLTVLIRRNTCSTRPIILEIAAAVSISLTSGTSVTAEAILTASVLSCRTIGTHGAILTCCTSCTIRTFRAILARRTSVTIRTFRAILTGRTSCTGRTILTGYASVTVRTFAAFRTLWAILAGNTSGTGPTILTGCTSRTHGTITSRTLWALRARRSVRTYGLICRRLSFPGLLDYRLLRCQHFSGIFGSWSLHRLLRNLLLGDGWSIDSQNLIKFRLNRLCTLGCGPLWLLRLLLSLLRHPLTLTLGFLCRSLPLPLSLRSRSIRAATSRTMSSLPAVAAHFAVLRIEYCCNA